MSRTLSLAMLMTAFAQETGEAIIPLITISHAEWDETIRVAMNGTDIESRGETFIAYPFDLVVPDDSSDRPPQASLTIDNIDRRITESLESTITPPTIDIEIIRSSDPETVEVSWEGLTLREVKYNKTAVSGTLTYEDMVKESFPKGTFTPAYFPGLF
jgi:hypothetical protein